MKAKPNSTSGTSTGGLIVWDGEEGSQVPITGRTSRETCNQADGDHHAEPMVKLDSDPQVSGPRWTTLQWAACRKMPRSD